MNKRPLAQWLQHLERLHPSEMELGLERVTRVARALGLLPVQVPVVTVAGTNGKGSTVAVLESLLTECGRCTGAFTSPHFLRFNERIRIARKEASDEEIVAAFAAIEEARADTSLTYFEYANLAALWLFRAHKVDVVLLEVGLGGRLDSANMVDADIAVITSIDLDHQEWLGDSREAIAREKAGIIRPGRPVVIAEPDPPGALLNCVAAEEAGPVLRMGEEFDYSETAGRWQGRVRNADGEPRDLPSTPRGSLLPANICAATQAALLLGVPFSDAQFSAALVAAYRVGRCQRLELAGRYYLLDVAHNPAAVDKLLENIDATPCNGKTIALFSAMKDKPVSEMLAACGDRFDAWFLGEQADNPRAMAAGDIAEILRGQGQVMISVSKNLRQAFRRAQGLMGEEDMLVVFGSFFTVAAVLPQLEKDRGKVGTDE